MRGPVRTGDLTWLVCASADVPAGDDWLSPAERDVLGGLRFPKRRGDFRLGRWAAKNAVLASLGEGAGVGGERAGQEAERPMTACARLSILAAADGAPEVWIAGERAPVAVSIAHSGGSGLAAAGPPAPPFGADIETIERRTPEMIEDFFTATEQAWVRSLGEARGPWGASLVWSAKEAALKALRVGLREDTRAVEVRVGAPTEEEAVRVAVEVRSTGRRFEGWSRVEGGRVLVLVAERRLAGGEGSV